MFNIMDSIKYTLPKKQNPGGTDAHLSLKIFASKVIFIKIMVPLDGMWSFGTTLKTLYWLYSTSGCGEDSGISKAFWTLRHCPEAFWKPVFLFKSP